MVDTLAPLDGCLLRTIQGDVLPSRAGEPPVSGPLRLQKLCQIKAEGM
jgi:hypothetical protein